jgi:hypothetical protein
MNLRKISLYFECSKEKKEKITIAFSTCGDNEGIPAESNHHK